MRRSRLESLLHDYVNGDLGEAECREVKQRIEADPKARALHEEVRAAQDALRLLRDRPEPPVAARDVFPAIQAAIAARAFEPRPQLALEGLGTRYYRRVAIAATLLFAVAVGYISIRGSTSVAPPPPKPPSSSIPTASPLDLGGRREGISGEEFLSLLRNTRDPSELRVEPVVNVVEIAESK